MPIKGLSDQLRLPRLGKIRLGEKKVSKKSGREYPVSLDYFVCPQEVQAVYGKKPRQLDVMFPTDDEAVIFPQHYKRYGAQKGLICKGDGETADMMTDKGEMVEIPCPGKDCQYFKKEECKVVGNLHVWLWKVAGLGVYQIDTSSINSILNINGGIRTIKGIFGGRLRWIPLVLKVEMQETHPFVEDKQGQRRRMATTVPVMSLTAQVSVEELIKQVKEKEKKGELPGAPAEIINPQVDEKPELLYTSEDSETQEEVPEELEKEAEDLVEQSEEAVIDLSEEEDAEEEEKEKEYRIDELFRELNYPSTRRRMLENKYKDKDELIKYLEGKLKDAKTTKQKENSTGQTELFQDQNLY